MEKTINWNNVKIKFVENMEIQIVENDFIIYSINKNVIYSFNRTASFICECIKNDRNFEEIVNEMYKRYGECIDKSIIESDVCNLLNVLYSNEVIVLSEQL